ncbi:hypothetical protein LGT39_01370, partial [Demequina sp. TTPB684]|nr:hypothetical protein [Demequina sp. TTPB684]
ESCTMSTSYVGLGMPALIAALVFAVPVAVLTAILVGLLGVRDANEPRDVAVMAALGQTRAAAMRVAATTGLRHAAIGVGGAYLLTGAAHLAILATTGWPVLTTEVELWLGRFILAGVGSVALILAHVIDATRPRRTPVERLHEDAVDIVDSHRSITRNARIIGCLGGLASGLVVGLAISHDELGGEAPSAVKTTAGVAVTVLAFACVGLLLAVVIPWARGIAPRVLHASAAIAGRFRAPRLAVILDSRAHSASIVGGRIVSVLGGMAFLVGFLSAGPTSPAMSDLFLQSVHFGTTGSPHEVIDQYRAIDGVTVVVGKAQPPSDDFAPVLVNPGDLAEVDETLRALLLRYPRAVIGGCGSSLESSGFAGFVPSGIVPLERGCVSLVNDSAASVGTGSYALLLYAEEGADRSKVQTILNGISPQGTGVTYSGYSTMGASSTTMLGTLVEVGLVVILVVVPMVALSVGVARRRRRDDATLAALGAAPRTLRTAVVVESTAIAAFSVATGLAWGALAHALVTAVNFARLSLGGVITDSYLRWTLSSIAWSDILMIGAAAVLVFGATSAVAALALRRRTPVENHRPVSSRVLS